MNEVCSLAKADQLGAIFVPGLIVIWAKVTTPNQYYKAKIKPSPYLSHPPQYDLVQCHEGFIPQVYNPTERQVSFLIPAGIEPAEDHVLVNTADGRQSVSLFIAKTGPAPVDPADSKSLTAFGVPGIFNVPPNLSKVFETGDSADVSLPGGTIKRAEAVGYSASFSFEEAFNNAIQNMPPDENYYPDKLNYYQVDSIGAETGGIAGIHQMVVKISTIY